MPPSYSPKRVRKLTLLTPTHNPTLNSLATRSASTLLITYRLYWLSAWQAESPNISHGWLPKETAVFAIELAGAFVSDFKSRTRGVQTINEHESPRRLQPKLLLILKRTHGGQRAEMMVQRGESHARDLCQIFDS